MVEAKVRTRVAAGYPLAAMVGATLVEVHEDGSATWEVHLRGAAAREALSVAGTVNPFDNVGAGPREGFPKGFVVPEGRVGEALALRAAGRPCLKCGSARTRATLTTAWVVQCQDCRAAWDPPREAPTGGAAQVELPLAGEGASWPFVPVAGPRPEPGPLGMPMVEVPHLRCPRCGGSEYFVLSPTRGDPIGNCSTCGPVVIKADGDRYSAVAVEVKA